MIKTAWTSRRLQRLFVRYNKRFWKGKLPQYSVVATTQYNGGLCKKRERTILINIYTQECDRRVRSTLLHEMAHAACPSGADHGKVWLKEMERLKERGAPIPKDELSYKDPKRVIRPRAIIGRFEDAAAEGVPWKKALLWLGWEHGWIDAKGNPVSEGYKRLIEDAKKAFRRARREYLRDMKIEREFAIRRAKNLGSNSGNS